LCLDLEDINLGKNKLEGGVKPLGQLRNLRRLIINNNSLQGHLDGLLPCTAIETLNLSYNAGLFGPLPGDLHARWTNGQLPCETSGTRVGAHEDGRPLTPTHPRDPDAGDSPFKTRVAPAELKKIKPGENRLSHEKRKAMAEANLAKAMEQQQAMMSKLSLGTPGSPGSPAMRPLTAPGRAALLAPIGSSPLGSSPPGSSTLGSSPPGSRPMRPRTTGGGGDGGSGYRGRSSEAWSALPRQQQQQSPLRKTAAPSPQQKSPAAKLVLEDLDA